MNKNLSVSIVIPVYNEEEHLSACLEAIAAQTVQPYEVIVVDNNSTDSSRVVAERFPFVRLISETRQGVIHARTTGFDAAHGDVIGRIDADTIIAPDWVETLQDLFAANTDMAALTGRMYYYQLVMKNLLDSADFYIRKRLARLMGREVAMQGANMAVRKEAWRAIRSKLCNDKDMHEDYDLAIHLTQNDYIVAFDETLKATISFRQAHSSWRVFSRYALISPRTYAMHHLRSRRHMYPVVALVIICYPLLKVLHKGYDVERERFTWRSLFLAATQTRVNPATFVD